METNGLLCNQVWKKLYEIIFYFLIYSLSSGQDNVYVMSGQMTGLCMYDNSVVMVLRANCYIISKELNLKVVLRNESEV